MPIPRTPDRPFLAPSPDGNGEAPHAVVGDHAVAAWVARIDPAVVRTTVDIDAATLDRRPVALRPRLAELLAKPDG